MRVTAPSVSGVTKSGRVWRTPEVPESEARSVGAKQA